MLLLLQRTARLESGDRPAVHLFCLTVLRRVTAVQLSPSAPPGEKLIPTDPEGIPAQGIRLWDLLYRRMHLHLLCFLQFLQQTH
ncbi:hypothetical protein E2562_021420 [Oryza meyeriana var. granulata]|uniref:Uncharacterized protein n=1 Tax=Oryza meyeriana var. granulata TaxID=110450 RepID=A0A6G1EXM9_9ORYZ|nr:hypothetical protein E2562_021420 [Oryza meyeriana var. granulata]